MDKAKISERIKTLRQKYNYSYDYIAQICDTTVLEVQAWEESELVPSVKNITKLSMVFGVSIDDIVNYQESTITRLWSRWLAVGCAIINLILGVRLLNLMLYAYPVGYYTSNISGMFDGIGNPMKRTFFLIMVFNALILLLSYFDYKSYFKNKSTYYSYVVPLSFFSSGSALLFYFDGFDGYWVQFSYPVAIFSLIMGIVFYLDKRKMTQYTIKLRPEVKYFKRVAFAFSILYFTVFAYLFTNLHEVIYDMTIYPIGIIVMTFSFGYPMLPNEFYENKRNMRIYLFAPFVLMIILSIINGFFTSNQDLYIEAMVGMILIGIPLIAYFGLDIYSYFAKYSDKKPIN